MSSCQIGKLLKARQGRLLASVSQTRHSWSLLHPRPAYSVLAVLSNASARSTLRRSDEALGRGDRSAIAMGERVRLQFPVLVAWLWMCSECAVEDGECTTTPH